MDDEDWEAYWLKSKKSSHEDYYHDLRTLITPDTLAKEYSYDRYNLTLIEFRAYIADLALQVISLEKRNQMKRDLVKLDKKLKKNMHIYYMAGL